MGATAHDTSWQDELAGLLKDSSRADTAQSQKAFCVEIKIDARTLDFIGQPAETFSTLLIDYLAKAENRAALERVCRKLRDVLPGKESALDRILAEIRRVGEDSSPPQRDVFIEELRDNGRLPVRATLPLLRERWARLTELIERHKGHPEIGKADESKKHLETEVLIGIRTIGVSFLMPPKALHDLRDLADAFARDESANGNLRESAARLRERCDLVSERRRWVVVILVAAATIAIWQVWRRSSDQADDKLKKAQMLKIATVSLPHGIAGHRYKEPISYGIDGGVPPYFWSLVKSSTKDQVLDEKAGVLSFLPNNPGDYLISGSITDARHSTAAFEITIHVDGESTGSAPVNSEPPKTAKESKSTSVVTGERSSTKPQAKEKPRTVAAVGTLPLSLSVSLTRHRIPAGTCNENYSQSVLPAIAVTGGTGKYIWSLNRSPVNGLKIDENGTLYGMPLRAGPVELQVQIADASASAVATVKLVLDIRLNIHEALPEAVIGELYSTHLRVEGGDTAAYSWELKSELNGGWSLTKAGVLSGTPRDGNSLEFSAEVSTATGIKQIGNFTLRTRVASLRIEPLQSAPKDWIPYKAPVSLKYQAKGGLGEYHWSVSRPVLQGLTPEGENTSALEITGSPSKLGAYSFKVHLADGNSAVDSDLITLDVRLRTTVQPRTHPSFIEALRRKCLADAPFAPDQNGSAEGVLHEADTSGFVSIQLDIGRSHIASWTVREDEFHGGEVDAENACNKLKKDVIQKLGGQLP